MTTSQFQTIVELLSQQGREIQDEILNAIGTELQEFYKKTEREHHQFNKRLTKLEKRLA